MGIQDQTHFRNVSAIVVLILPLRTPTSPPTPVTSPDARISRQKFLTLNFNPFVTLL